MTQPAGTEVTLIVCGAPLTARAPDLVAALLGQGVRPTVIGTPASAAWLPSNEIAGLTGVPPRFEFRSPTRTKRSGQPVAVVVCPATFNTVNKAAIGATDTYALAVLCEAIGAGLPTLIVPMVNDKLWGHPAWARSVVRLRRAGAAFLDIQSGERGTAPVRSGTGFTVAERFDPMWLTAELARLLLERQQ